MNKKLSGLLLMLFLSACAMQSPYRPAVGSGAGYTDSIISDNQYRVHFKIRNDNRAEAMDFALLRAAELTIEKGFDWFIVIDRQTIAEQERHHPNVNVAIGTSRRYHSNVGFGVGMDFSDRDETEVVLEINMGSGAKPEDKNSYNAAEVRMNLRNTHGLAK